MLDRLLQKLRDQGQKQKALLWFLGIVVSLSIVALIVLTSGGLPSVQGSDQNTGPISSARLVLDVIVKLGLVLLLIFVTFRVIGKINPQGARVEEHSLLSVLETVHLTPQQSLHLIEVDQQYFLIGATDQSLTRLAALELSPEEVKALAKDSGASAETNLFQHLLQGQLQGRGDKGRWE